MSFVPRIPRPGFPEDKLEEFFVTGFRRQSKLGEIKFGQNDIASMCEAYDVRGILYFLLLAFGGLRSCEPLHLYKEDFEFDFYDGTGALVWLWHPVHGSVSLTGGRHTNRQAYLRDTFGLCPRVMVKGHQHAGWKNLLLDETLPGLGQRSRVHWVVPQVGHLAWHMYHAYTSHVRPRSDRHPYLFSSIWNEACGNPWSLDSVNRTFRQALAALDLKPCLGTGLSMHGFRHRIAHWMRLHNIPPEIVQIVLHHSSIESQATYGRPGAEEVSMALHSVVYSPNKTAGKIRYPDLFPPRDRMSRLGEIGCNLADFFLRGNS